MGYMAYLVGNFARLSFWDSLHRNLLREQETLAHATGSDVATYTRLTHGLKPMSDTKNLLKPG